MNLFFKPNWNWITMMLMIQWIETDSVQFHHVPVFVSLLNEWIETKNNVIIAWITIFCFVFFTVVFCLFVFLFLFYVVIISFSFSINIFSICSMVQWFNSLTLNALFTSHSCVNLFSIKTNQFPFNINDTHLNIIFLLISSHFKIELPELKLNDYQFIQLHNRMMKVEKLQIFNWMLSWWIIIYFDQLKISVYKPQIYESE